MTDVSLSLSHKNIKNLYRSLPLPRHGKWIRILDIEGSESSEPNGGPLRSNMRVVDLKHRPSFTALSYVWRQQTADASQRHNSPNILCNDIPLSITANCYSALWHIRQRLGNFSIWIDAVCINQEDKEEKAFLIPLMGDIYAGAKEVYIWLGEGNETTDRAMAYLGQSGFLKYYLKSVNTKRKMPFKSEVWAAAWSALIAFCSLTRHPFPFLSKDFTPTGQFPLFRRKIASDIALYTTYYDLNELLDQEWMKRIWTYQEVMLAGNPIIVCGHSHLRWSRFALSILFLDYIRPKRLGNLGIPTDSTLQTWKKIVLTRARLLEAPLTEMKRSGREGTTPNPHENKTTMEGKEAELSRPIDVQKYRQFLFDTFYTCLMLFCTIGTIAYLSLFNLLAASIIASFNLSKRSPTPRTVIGFSIYISLSIVAFLTVFPFYVTMIYSYYHKTFFSMPVHLQYKTLLREDAIDDFIDAIVTRRATEPRDMAFGLQTILERRLGKLLPPPDYKVLLAQIYRQLTRYLMETTGQLQFLVPAARNKMHGQPSWVPDWSAEMQSFWLQPFVSRQVLARSSRAIGWFERMPKHHASSQQRTPSDQRIPPGNGNPQKLWRFDPLRDDALTILAYPFGTITHIFTLRPTKTKYDPQEKHIHLENISILSSILEPSFLSYMVNQDYFTNRLNFTTLSPNTSPHHLRAYFLFIWHSQKRTPERILELLTRENAAIFFPMPYGLHLPLWLSTTYKELFEMHVAICNDLAVTGRKFLKARVEGRGGGRREEVAGVCGGESDVGDRVLMVPGLRSMLVVKRAKEFGEDEKGDVDSIGSGKEDMRLVSPAVVFVFVEMEVEEMGVEGLKPFVLL